MDPGPSDHSLLQLQQRHRSSQVWRGQVTQALRVRRRLNAVEQWVQFHSRIVPYLRSSGFYGVARVGFFSFDWHLITAFVERWRPETHTFHMHCGECTITLQDVEVQLGLPIEGMPVIGETDIDYADVCERLLGARPGPDDLSGNKIQVSWLQDSVPSIGDNSDEVAVQRYVRAYILQLIGGCLFADKSNRFVHLMFLPLLEDLEMAGRYSWGSACLAYLYRELCRASFRGANEISGAVIILQLWAWDRFPSIAPQRLGRTIHTFRTLDGVQLPNDAPLGHRWIDVYSVSETSTHVLLQYRDEFDLQSETDVVWQPYADVLQSLPQYCTQGYRSWRSNCPLICFHIVEWHRPERVLRQFGLTQVVPPHCDFDARLHRIELRGHSQQNWAVFHAQYVQMWEDRGENIATGEPETEGHDYEPYMTWYRSITRRYIGRNGAMRDFAVDLVHQLRRVLPTPDGLERGIALCDDGIRIMDEDNRQSRTRVVDDEDFLQSELPDETYQQVEEESQRQTRGGRRRRTRRTETVGESSQRSSPPRTSRPVYTPGPPMQSEADIFTLRAEIGESSQRLSPPRPSRHVYTTGSPPMHPEAYMFAPRAAGMNVPSYNLDPFAPGPSSSYMDNTLPRHSVYVPSAQYMPSPFTPSGYNLPYSGEGSYMHLLGMPPHVHITQQHQSHTSMRGQPSASRYVGMVQPPIFDDIGAQEATSNEEEDRNVRRNPRRTRRRPPCGTESRH